MKAVILVGGFGTRLRPLSLSMPKPLIHFAGKPMIQHQIEALVNVGVTEIVLAVSHMPEALQRFVDKYEQTSTVQFHVSQEPEPLDTAGPLAFARALLENTTEPIFVLNSDVICSFPLEEMLAFHKSHQREGTILVTRVSEPQNFGVVLADAQTGQVQKFIEKPKVFVGDCINAGIYLLNASVLDRIQPRKTSIEKEIFPRMAADSQLFTFVLQGFWSDVGQPADYLKGLRLYLDHLQENHPEMLLTGPNVIPPVLATASVQVSDRSLIGPYVSLDANVQLGQSVRLSNCAVMQNTRIGDAAFIQDSIIGWKCKIGEWCRVENLTVFGEDVTLTKETHINGAKVLPHKTLSANVLSPTTIM